MPLEQPFSKRNRYSGGAKEITIREDAPENLRYVVLQTAVDLGWAPSSLRTVICRVLRVPPDSGNWSEYPNIWGEVESLMYRCDWYKVYDIIEVMYARFARNDAENRQQDAVQFAGAINSFFEEEGIGWPRRRFKHLTVPRPLATCTKPCKTFRADRSLIWRARSIMRWARWNAWRAMSPEIPKLLWAKY